ncbi:hypothetical protein [Mitsuokella sp.]|uniref:hypothetical protein n=1 Tax=Mitsuokella sp. TaxID=2049034 RepID=UPI002A81D63B|nr:hypothetical protein [Mitsuokella sp.]MDY4475234.1 hypothetical protein [Mitsuokella sp.]
MPVVVDFSRRIETELQLVGIVLLLGAISLLIARTRVGVTSLSRPSGTNNTIILAHRQKGCKDSHGRLIFH